MNSPDEHPTLSTIWLDNIQQMDTDSWRRLVNVFGPIVYRWSRKSGVPESDAADVVQEVFASVARGISNFQREKSEGSFRSWLATITRNRVRDFYRRQAKSQNAAGGTEALDLLNQQSEKLDSSVSLAGIEVSLTHRLLTYVRAEFEQSTWDAFYQTTVDGTPASEVAQSLGISTASVYQSKSRVLRRLRQRVAELP